MVKACKNSGTDTRVVAICFFVWYDIFDKILEEMV
jgi:hypothetical protein